MKSHLAVVIVSISITLLVEGATANGQLWPRFKRNIGSPSQTRPRPEAVDDLLKGPWIRVSLAALNNEKGKRRIIRVIKRRLDYNQPPSIEVQQPQFYLDPSHDIEACKLCMMHIPRGHRAMAG